MKQRADDDIVMAQLIRDAKGRCEHKLDDHVERFRELRQKHPNHLPNRQEQYEIDKMVEMHERVVQRARNAIDNGKPKKALHYRSLMRRTPFTSGGFPRPVVLHSTLPKKRRRRRRKKADLPGRRTSLGFTEDEERSGADEYEDDGEDDYGDDDFDEDAGRTQSALGKTGAISNADSAAHGEKSWALPDIRTGSRQSTRSQNA